jgi:carboxymethylenebutenolidase
MGSTIELIAADGHRLSAYLSSPPGTPLGGIVVIQEIFGVTRHIRAVTDQYAAAGFQCVAPALFDRVEKNVDVAYTDVARGKDYVSRLNEDQVTLDVQAAIDYSRSAGKVAIVGYCWGGTVAYLAAAKNQVDAAVSYYGAGIGRHVADGGVRPRVPIMFHFGETDASIPIPIVEEIETAVPGGIFHLYPAGHGFNCTERQSFEPASAKLALERSLLFLHRNIG